MRVIYERANLVEKWSNDYGPSRRRIPMNEIALRGDTHASLPQ